MLSYQQNSVTFLTTTASLYNPNPVPEASIQSLSHFCQSIVSSLYPPDLSAPSHILDLEPGSPTCYIDVLNSNGQALFFYPNSQRLLLATH